MRFLDIAFGSARELVYLESLATRLEFRSDADGAKINKLEEWVAGALASLRRSYGRH